MTMRRLLSSSSGAYTPDRMTQTAGSPDDIAARTPAGGYLVLPSGGLRYHARALLWHRRWLPFVERLGRWLRDEWAPAPRRALMLLGCSAGWCLPLELIASIGFSRVVAVDLDPLALLILRRRLHAVAPTLPFRAIVGDALGVQDAPPGRALVNLLAAHGRGGVDDDGDAHVLFCNVWGQQIFQVEDDNARARFKAVLPALLDGWSWASFFDRLSGPVAPQLDDGNAHSEQSLSDDVLTARFYARAPTPLSRIELVDHDCVDVVADRPRLHLHWPLRPGQHHLIEAVCGPRVATIASAHL